MIKVNINEVTTFQKTFSVIINMIVVRMRYYFLVVIRNACKSLDIQTTYNL